MNKTRWLFPLLFLLGLVPGRGEASAASRGVRLVGAPETGSPLLAGDRLVRWRSARGGGGLETPIDLELVRIHHLSRGAVRFEFVRGGRRRSVDVSVWPEGVSEWPALGARFDADVDRLVAANDFARLEKAIDEARLAPIDRAAILFSASKLAPPADAVRLLESALRAGALSGEKEALVRTSLGYAYGSTGQFGAGEAEARRAFDLWGEASPGRALATSRLGIIAWWAGDRSLAVATSRDAVRLARELAPGSLLAAKIFLSAGIVFGDVGEGDARGAWSESLEVLERLHPGSLAHADALGLMASADQYDGDIETAERRQLAALAIYKKKAPKGRMRTMTPINLAALADLRGDDVAAAAWFEEAERAAAQNGVEDGDELFFRYNRASRALAQRDFATAEREAITALEGIAQRRFEDFALVDLYELLAESQRTRGDLDTAADSLRCAAAIAARWKPNSLDHAHVEQQLAELEIEMGCPACGEVRLRRAVEATSRVRATLSEAQALNGLGRALRADGRLFEALDLFRRAVASLEDQQRRIGASPDRLAAFRARYLGFYRDLASLAAELGQNAEAFEALERARGRALLSMLADRKLEQVGIPAELAEVRRRLARDEDRLLGDLRSTDTPPAENDRLMEELLRIRKAQLDLRERIRRDAPRTAEALDPEPISLDDARKLLEPGELAMLWSVGPDETILHAVDRDGIEMARLPIGEKGLRERIDRFRRHVAARQSPETAGRTLARDLMGPIANKVARARVIYVAPDGPLWLVPYALLPDPADAGHPLVRRVSLVEISSMTALAWQRSQSPISSRGTLVAFGDPAYPIQEVVLRRGATRLGLLPETRREVVRVAEGWGGDSRVRLGIDANEAAARRDAPSGTVLHFAAHAVVDPRFPLESALVLSIPERPAGTPPPPHESDGLLQAWEIFDSVRIDADLVVLSACETALGEELAGEGMFGLTRAFQFAGARRVLSALWPVDDLSTTELMIRFHRELRAGATTDVALARAQRELAAGPIEVDIDGHREIRDFSKAWYWAGFVVNGDGN